MSKLLLEYFDINGIFSFFPFFVSSIAFLLVVGFVTLGKKNNIS